MALGTDGFRRDRNLGLELVAKVLELEGAAVPAGACTALEVAAAEAEGRYFKFSSGIGLVVRPGTWRRRGEWALEALAAGRPVTTEDLERLEGRK